ncbi:bifunctional hydroxymethylpyrimidine kinase/phosphomethylpyrimidine kinase [Sphingobium aquiterrae]|uniref:bifunctional hydroxymethylpyrimidine kinase/phosphomethylpyrimidine kinase n=1 Tax=Sphingobium aquiterrae TaxID=2038656 RepID=UPI00301A235E
MKPPRILIIAGSDSGGGAGIQADIKTVTMLGGHAMTAITAITAQNTLGVQAVHPVPTAMVIAQMDSVIADIGVDAVKIGMIGSAATAHAVADFLASSFPRRRESISDVADGGEVGEMDSRLRGNDEGRDIPIVFDPVMVATSGSALADAETVAAFERLMAVATMITPNVPELETLLGRSITSVDALESAAVTLMVRHGCSVMAKGGHLPDQPDDDEATVHDLLVTPGGVYEHLFPRLDTRHSHGTGCTLASAIATGLGAGLDEDDAVDRAEAFLHRALAVAPGLGKGHGPIGHALGQVPFYSILAQTDEEGWDAKAFAARWPSHA